MSFVRVNSGEVEIGQPVPWALYDDRKQLLLARGVVVETETQKRALMERGLFRKLQISETRAILQKLIGYRHILSRLVLMLQKEVVDRILAEPGDSSRGYLTVLVENAFRAERLFDVPPAAFIPRPKVDSTVVMLTPKRSTVCNELHFRELAGVAFTQKRKTILNNLKHRIERAEELLNAASIEPSRRAESLTSLEWAALVDAFSKNKEP